MEAAEDLNRLAWTEDDQQYASRCARTDVNDLNGEYARVPADLYYWRGRWVDCLEEESAAEGHRKNTAATVYQRLRAIKDQGSKAMTEAAIEAAIQTDQDYLNAVERERAAAVAKARIQAVVEAIKAKEQMLVSLGASMRHEVEMGLRERPRG